MGIEVEMPGGKGILVPNPLKDPADFETRIPKEVDVRDKLSHVIQAVVRIKQVIEYRVFVSDGRGSTNANSRCSTHGLRNRR